MRSLRVVVPFLFIAAAAHAEVPGVTTAPSPAELEQLRTDVHRLEAENEMLRAQLAAISVASPIPSATLPTPSPDERPLAGVEGIMQGMPREQMPGSDDAPGSLRPTLLRKWVQDHGKGKMITLRGRFQDASGLSGGHFVVRIGNGTSQQSRRFEATVVMSESDASMVLAFHKGSPVQVTGRIKNVDIAQPNDKSYVMLLDLDLAVISGEGGRH